MVDVTIRNIEAGVLRGIKVRAVEEGRTLGEMISVAIREFLVKPKSRKKVSNIFKFKPIRGLDPLLSQKIDELAYSD